MSMGKQLLVMLAAMGAVMIGVLGVRTAQAVVLLDQTSVVGGPAVSAPSQYSFTASSAQALTLTRVEAAARAPGQRQPGRR